MAVFGRYLTYGAKVRVTHRKTTYGWTEVPANVPNETAIEVKAKDLGHAREVAEKTLKKAGDRGEVLSVWSLDAPEKALSFVEEPKAEKAHEAGHAV